MAAATTIDTRTHVLGDLLMVTGTFTDGGLQVDYSSLVTQVFAAGGHITSLVPSGVTINNGGGYNPADTALTCDTTSVAGDCRSCLNVGQTVYDVAGAKHGIISAVTATVVTLEAPGLVAPIVDDAVLYVTGASSMALKADVAITSHTVALDVSIDETNTLVIFACGNESSAANTSTVDGRWWILGKR